MKKNTIAIIDSIKEKFSNYIYSTFTLEDVKDQERLIAILDDQNFFNGPYLHTALPFQTGNTIKEYIEKGVLDRSFYNLRFNVDLPLYIHQEEAIHKIKEGKNVVITTGTGSGKTESFLIPILDEILKMKQDPQKREGIKAIFLYPMNALVNDQKERIQSILENYPSITFASYTGETPEKENEIKERAFKNEIYSREAIRKSAPDLLFTNYSMLEYLLIRPYDYAFLRPERMKNFRFFVLDEAHTYKGSLAIEISYLLKRFQGTIQKETQFILTSATLGSPEQAKEIAEFASKLTSATFMADDIVFGKRKAMESKNIHYSIKPSDYLRASQNLENIETIRSIVSSYLSIQQNWSIDSLLYQWLLCDENVYTLFKTINGINDFEDVLQKMQSKYGFNSEELVSLIHLISLAKDGYSYLYETKFHLFVNVPQRAFMNLGKERQIEFGNRTQIAQEHAFEIGYCKNCHHLFIFGILEHEYLMTNEVVDLYENYDPFRKERLDFFVMDKPVDLEEDAYTEYEVCIYCGKVHEKEEIDPALCDCGNPQYISIYKIHQTGDTKKNNLNDCPYCQQHSDNGMISSFNLNKDTGTAVLSEIFYESIDEKQVEVKTQRPVKKSLFDKISIETTPKKNVKQLLAFSDSRQQASFFSVQFNNNHELFLRKRLVWDAIKETEGVNIRSLAMQLTNQIRKEGLFSKNQKHEQSEAWISVLQDLMYTSGRYSAQSLGLYAYQFELDPQILYENEAELRFAFQLNVEETITLFNILIDQMRHKCIIDYQVAELSDEEKINTFPYRNREQTIIEKREYNNHKDEYRYVESFLPVQAQRENKTSAYLQKLYPNAKREEIIDIMEKLFTLMCNLGILKETEASQVFSYHIPVEKFKVIPYTKLTWYQCDKCKRVTLYNIHGMCPEHDCPGTLHRCDVDQVFANHYYRNNYKTKKIENVIAQEHTAQLKNDKAKQYQIDFKNKKINVLSCSTTFEMGVNLGSLEYVFCRNIPPTPANYIQRAGRAGRSKDASALIMTYCQNESHDYYYYQRPKDMISGKIDPPQFKVENEKIALRHILASAFAHYFRKHPDHFRNISFVYDDHLEPFIDYINNNPKDLVEYIDQWVLKNTNLEAFKQSKWIDALKKDESVLSKYIQETSELVNTLEAAKDKASQSENFRQADYFKNQIDNLNKKNILEDLSKFAIIPKYGFPVDLIRMEVPQDHSVDLQRDLLIGISEYAPDSEVIADEKKFVSRYIELPKKTGKELTKTYYYTCEECHDTQVSLEPFEEGSLCPTCFKPYKKTDLFFLEPRFGFVASNEKRSKNIKPIKSYAGEIRYLGKGLPFKEKVLLANKIRLTAI